MPNNLPRIVPEHGSMVYFIFSSNDLNYFLFYFSAASNIVHWKDLYSLYHPSISLLLLVTCLEVCPYSLN